MKLLTKHNKLIQLKSVCGLPQ